VEYQYRDILKAPPEQEELEQLAAMGNMELTELINTGSKAFKDTGADPQKITNREAGEIISKNPRAMHRPLLTDGKGLVVGFKPEEMEGMF